VQTLPIALGQHFRLLAHNRQLTQTAISKRLRICQTCISAHMRGRAPWTARFLAKVAALFGCTPAEFVAAALSPKSVSPSVSVRARQRKAA